MFVSSASLNLVAEQLCLAGFYIFFSARGGNLQAPHDKMIVDTF